MAARGLSVAYYSFAGEVFLRGRSIPSRARDMGFAQRPRPCAARSNWNSIFMAACSASPRRALNERVEIANMAAHEG
jgi:hypothetical protein